MGSCLSSRDDKKKRSLEASRPRTGLLVTELKEKNGVIGMHGSSMESAQFQNQLHRIPGRMLLNGSSCMASLFTQKGLKGTNQDAMIVWENVGSRKGVVFCGVFDGHGPFGHLVARRVRDSLPLKLIADWEMSLKGSGMRKSSISNHSSKKSEEIESIFVEDESKAFFVLEDNVPEVFVALKESFLKAFKFMDKDLMQHPNIDCFTSGTTAATLVKLGQHVMIGNVGDSRAVLGTRDHEDNLVAVQLTMDLKPNLPEEAERIRRCRGRVFALRGEPDVPRVWLPNYDTPGLSMARAFGDFCLKDFGLISVPEIFYHCITDNDEFIVLATDGVWDVLSNKEVVDIVASSPARSTTARSIVEHAVRSWRIKYPTSKVDDCAAVCLFLNPIDKNFS